MKTLTYCLLLLIAFSCKKPPSCNGFYTEQPKLFLDYWYFKQGSYWIYKAKGKEAYDTIKVVSDWTNTTDVKKNAEGSTDKICSINYFIEQTHSYYSCDGTPAKETLFATDKQQHLSLYATCFFVYPNYETFEVKSYSGSTLQVGDTTYDQVWKTTALAFAPNIGAIQRINSDSIIWELKSYSIIK